MNRPATRINTYLAREYRRLRKPSFGETLLMLVCYLSVIVTIVIFYKEISIAVSRSAVYVIRNVLDVNVHIAHTDFLPLKKDIYFVALDNVRPTFVEAAVCAGVSLLSILFLIISGEKMRPLKMYFMLSFFILLVSAVFFMFLPMSFPYTLSQYSVFYMKQEVFIWMILPLLAALSLSMFTKGGFTKVAVFYAIAINAFLFGSIRYIVYLCILAKFGSMYIAVLMFAFGLIFDLLQMITIYSYCVRRICFRLESYGVERGKEVWQ